MMVKRSHCVRLKLCGSNSILTPYFPTIFLEYLLDILEASVEDRAIPKKKKKNRLNFDKEKQIQILPLKVDLL